MWLILFRVFMVALLAHAGYFYSPIPGQPWAGATLGARLVAQAMHVVEDSPRPTTRHPAGSSRGCGPSSPS